MFSKMPGPAPRTTGNHDIGGGARFAHVVVPVHLIEEGEVAERQGRRTSAVRLTEKK
ncbi:hypothetical protein ABT373_26435 [Streptomyces sp. NPDC000070]|uniref:hypothetical protein n=1 Tax=Streptomyces sp. NPDC000070 TaxID=3154240 RepID=UPI00331D604F